VAWKEGRNYWLLASKLSMHCHVTQDPTTSLPSAAGLRRSPGIQGANKACHYKSRSTNHGGRKNDYHTPQQAPSCRPCTCGSLPSVLMTRCRIPSSNDIEFCSPSCSLSSITRKSVVLASRANAQGYLRDTCAYGEARYYSCILPRGFLPADLESRLISRALNLLQVFLSVFRSHSDVTASA
jgi:hypothetical protein